MTSLFILQLICCIITAMLAVHLAMASLQVRWRVQRYEVSRWLLCGAMLLFSVHYLLQMLHGLRAQGTDVGAVFNILFYTPVAFIITLSIINMESTGGNVRRYCLRGAAAYALIVTVFLLGTITHRSLHIGSLLYVMLGLFVTSMVYFIHVIRHDSVRRKEKLMQESGSDLIPYVRYSQTSFLLLYLTAALLPIAILFNALLFIIGPLMLLAIVFFIHTFISLGYYLTPVEGEGEPMMEDVPSEFSMVGGVTKNNGNDRENGTQMPSPTLSHDRVEAIEKALDKWCEEKQYKDSEVSIFSLAAKLGYPKNELTQYFNQSAHTNFRTWLSEVRFNEALRLIKAHPEYSNDAISTECGFSSHTQIYRIFKQKTGMSPNQWREQDGADAS